MDTDQADIDLIERYLHGRLTPAGEADFNRRLGEDREFARKLRLRKTFPEFMKETGEPEPIQVAAPVPSTNNKGKSLLHSKLAYLILGIILVAATVVILIFVVKTPQNKEKAGERASTPLEDTTTAVTPKNPEKDLAHPVPDNIPKQPIQLESPAEGMTFGRKGDILFQWKLETDTFTNLYIFSATNNKMVLWKGIKPGTCQHSVASITLFPGSYYWYVGSRDVKRTFNIEERY